MSAHSHRTVLRGGVVVDGTGMPRRRADVEIAGDRIGAIGEVDDRPGDAVVDATGRFVMPGLIDAHAHVDGRVFDPGVQLALLRQGVTTVIGGQDGVSYAPVTARGRPATSPPSTARTPRTRAAASPHCSRRTTTPHPSTSAISFRPALSGTR